MTDQDIAVLVVRTILEGMGRDGIKVDFQRADRLDTSLGASTQLPSELPALGSDSW